MILPVATTIFKHIFWRNNLQTLYARSPSMFLGGQIMAKYDKKSQEKVKKTMSEMKKGKLHIGKSGKKVTDPKQAVAIALDQARDEGSKAPKPKKKK
jgi:GTP cyclohydrolase III